MSTVLSEDDLTITFPKGVHAFKFDDSRVHGLTNTMSTVDFIAETNRQIFFIEFKDPDHPNPEAVKNREQYLKEFQSAALDKKLIEKCRDTFLYQHLLDRLAIKPIYYFVVIGAKSFTSNQLLHRTEAIKKKLPLCGPHGRGWEKSFITDAAVFNITSWNRQFPQFPIIRRSESMIETIK